MNLDYWKEKYRGAWAQAGSREAAVAKMLSDTTGVKVRVVGFGAGSTEFLSGNAPSHGYQKGDADLEVEGTNIRIEVTGPLTENVDVSQGLWVRPDKIDNARTKLGTNDVWVVHCLGSKGVLRSIHLDHSFISACRKGRFPLVKREPRGVPETYFEIPADSTWVSPLQKLISTIKARANKK